MRIWLSQAPPQLERTIIGGLVNQGPTLDRRLATVRPLLERLVELLPGVTAPTEAALNLIAQKLPVLLVVDAWPSLESDADDGAGLALELRAHDPPGRDRVQVHPQDRNLGAVASTRRGDGGVRIEGRAVPGPRDHARQYDGNALATFERLNAPAELRSLRMRKAALERETVYGSPMFLPIL